MNPLAAEVLRSAFVDGLGFTPDGFQLRAFDAIDAGASVVVAAPTGSGKTVVAEYAVHRARKSGGKVFYTAPIKALSNQKYHDFLRLHGPDQVGLLTGDNSINERAAIVVMTTEVLRNMIYARSPLLEGLRYVVHDEVHYLQDTYRGPVWEEVIIHTPLDVDLVCLSATVSNAEDLAAWVTNVRGHTVAVIHEERPIELTHLYLVGNRDTGEVTMLPTFVNGRPNPQATKLDAESPAVIATRGNRRFATATPRRTEIVHALKQQDMLPLIYFIFSRAACDEAVGMCSHGGVRLTLPDERRDIARIVAGKVRSLSEADRDVLDYRRFLTALENGYAAHHAGMVPPFKEAVEACFAEGLVKVVFATETLALGINMPARTVVIEKLTKFNGERHEFLTAGEYTQLTGRAGRRGIDPIGYAATLWNPFVAFEQIAALAARRTYELRSSFRPTSNMAINLVRRYSADEAHHLLSLSFAQHQIDTAGAIDRARIRRLTSERDEAARQAICELGSVAELLASRRKAPAAPRAPERDVAHALEAVRPGDVVAPSTGNAEHPGDGWLVVVSTANRRGRDVQLRALTTTGRLLSLTPRDFRTLPSIVSRIALPTPFNVGSRSFRKAAASALQKAASRQRTDIDGEPHNTRDVVVPSPVADCPDLDLHVAALDRCERLDADIARVRGHSRAQARSIVDQFDAVLQLLEYLGYLDGWSVSESGRMLGGLYHEADLLIAECLVEGVFDGLTPPQLAGLVSGFVFEARGPGAGLSRRTRTNVATRGARGGPRGRVVAAERGPRRGGDLPGGFPKTLAPRWWAITDIADALAVEESERGLPLTRPVDPGFVAVAVAWAGGNDLDEVLEDAEITGGDFVRTIKMLVDLLRQIGQVAPSASTASAARSAADALFRGVVAASSLVAEAVRTDEAVSGPTASVDVKPA